MPVKKTKNSELKGFNKLEKNVKSDSLSKENVEKGVEKNIEKNTMKDTKKVVVRRRKSDLKLTKASAVAIVSQANRAKKQALIEKVANSDNIPVKKSETSDTKIPLRVWVFFWCSLLLFCVSFYQAIIRPQIEKENVVMSGDWIDESENNNYEMHESENEVIWETVADDVENIEEQLVMVPETATDVIKEFFVRLSDRDFDGAFDLMTPNLKGYPDIKNHFTSFRMDPFLDWVEWWKIVPENIQYVKSPTYWKDVYSFDLSYVMESDQAKFEEVWEFGVNSSSGEPKISSIRCVSTKCSYHPIFWPENFGLMR